MDKLSDIRFNLTEEMANNIIEVSDLKKQLIHLQDEINQITDENEKILLMNEENNLKSKIEQGKKRFIKAFQNNNKKQIAEYLASKNN